MLSPCEDGLVELHSPEDIIFKLKNRQVKDQPDWHGVDEEEVKDEVEQRIGLPHGQGNLKL